MEQDDLLGDNIITAIDENGEEIDMFILDSAIYKDVMYVLAVEDNEDEMEDEDEIVDATILKQVVSGDDYITYAFVEDDEEFEKVMEMFEENDAYEFEGE